MSSPARALKSRSAARREETHLHLPSVHIRPRSGPDTGFDYEEDIYFHGRGRDRAAERVVTLRAVECGNITLERVTTDVLSAEELKEVDLARDFYLDAENPELIGLMQERARREFARQRRIAAGREQACASCGCSESRACSGGCVWASKAVCSRCV